MPLTGEQKILILVAVVIIVLVFLYTRNSSKSRTAQDVEHLDATISNDSDSVSTGSASTGSSMTSAPSPSVDSSSASASSGSTEATVIRRGKNANYTNSYKEMSYNGNSRGGAGDIDKFFINGNSENAAENREFSPADFVSDKHATYMPKKTDEGLLPVEEKDWFEDVTPTKIKNRHLINIYRPVGVNTISTSLKNPSLDLRGAPANPKQVVSPFLNSSIEPDHNIKGLCV